VKKIRLIEITRKLKSYYVSLCLSINENKRLRVCYVLGKLLIPIFLGLIYFLIVYLFLDYNMIYPLVIAHLFPPLGRESIIPIGLASGVSPLVLVGTMATLEMIVGLFFVWNYDLVKGIPYAGEKLKGMEISGRKTLDKSRWMKKFAFTSVFLLVFVPFQGSGIISAAVLGRIIGMRPRNIFISITIAAVASCTLIAYFTDFMISLILSDFFIGFLVLVILIIVFILTRNILKDKIDFF